MRDREPPAKDQFIALLERIRDYHENILEDLNFLAHSGVSLADLTNWTSEATWLDQRIVEEKAAIRMLDENIVRLKSSD